jgi:hypothetical protein
MNAKQVSVHPEPCEHGNGGRNSGKKKDRKKNIGQIPAGGIHDHLLSFKTNEKIYTISLRNSFNIISSQWFGIKCKIVIFEELRVQKPNINLIS